jgi:tetratricopeptide (TPR) repeat protein
MLMPVSFYLMPEVTFHKLWYRYFAVARMTAIQLFAQVVLVWVLGLSTAWAGGGPETTLVVVNASSPISLTIANAYVRMRHIPDNHVVWLDDVPAADSIDIKEFRDRIWKPIRDYITDHQLQDQIDTIAYSGDFPYRVDFTSDLKTNTLPKNRYLGRYASLTGLTFFARRVEREDLGYLGVNRYFRRDLALRDLPPRPLSEGELKIIENATQGLKKQDYEEAVASLQALVKDYPWSADAWFQLTRGLASLGRSDEAMTALSKAVDTGWPDSLQASRDRLLLPLHTHPGFSALLDQMRLKIGPYQAAHGFRNQYIWTGGAAPVVYPNAEDALDRYYLATDLAYTGLRGNSLPEILDYLRTSVASDGSFPDGAVYLMVNSDVRAETREGAFYGTVAALKQRGHRAEILIKGQDGQDGIVPQNRQDVMGVVAGTRRFDWARSHSQMLPGAIAESLTSYGGDFDNSAQTKLTEFLRYGAAGSSGAVAEPYSIQAKFPVPALHIHYADGNSLAEAFYESVEAPYQLIVVGEPLARPFAHFAAVSLASPDVRYAWHDTVLLKPLIKQASGHPIHHLELWVDGRYKDVVAPWDVFLWDTNTVEDGCHDLRLVAVEDSPIETRSYGHTSVVVNNGHHQVEVKNPGTPVALGDEIILSGSAADARRIQIVQGTRLLGAAPVEDGRWSTAVDSRSLGIGKVALYARASYPDGSTARSCEASVTIEPPLHLLAADQADATYEVGLQVLMHDRAGKDHELVIKSLNGRFKELRKYEETVASLRLAGEFKVGKSGFYQLALATRGRLNVKIDGHSKIDSEISGQDQQAFIALNLDAGWHRIDIELVPEGRPSLNARLSGEEVAIMLAGERLRHRIEP